MTDDSRASKIITLPTNERTQEVPPPSPEDQKRQANLVERGYATAFGSLRLMQTADLEGWSVTRVPSGWVLTRALMTGTNRLAPGHMRDPVTHVVSCFVPFPPAQKIPNALERAWRRLTRKIV